MVCHRTWSTFVTFISVLFLPLLQMQVSVPLCLDAVGQSLSSGWRWSWQFLQNVQVFLSAHVHLWILTNWSDEAWVSGSRTGHHIKERSHLLRSSLTSWTSAKSFQWKNLPNDHKRFTVSPQFSSIFPIDNQWTYRIKPTEAAFCENNSRWR